MREVVIGNLVESFVESLVERRSGPQAVDWKSASFSITMGKRVRLEGLT